MKDLLSCKPIVDMIYNILTGMTSYFQVDERNSKVTLKISSVKESYALCTTH